jgi:RNA polymerase sigma factor (sigma-70 family)
MSDQTTDSAFADSTELYTACRSVDPLTLAAAYETLWGYLYRVALQVVYDQPEAEMLAQDCAQRALIRIHERITECREPAAFRTWARRIVTNLAIDTLRRAKREILLNEGESDHLSTSAPLEFEGKMLRDDLLSLISRAPISDRSRRTVLGRYMDGIPDEKLAQEESRLAGQSVRPSHLQVTRSKNISKLRRWKPLRTFEKLIQ